MKIRVDADKCHGHARCHALCPELFAIDDVDGKSRVRVEQVPEGLRELARRAADRCPEDAISWED